MIMDPLGWLGVLLGLGVLLLVIVAVVRGELRDLEGPKYEMLGVAPPEERPERVPGRIGVEDRIVRLGLVGAAFYYAAQAGWTRTLGMALAALGTYLLITGLVGRDPLYRRMGWDTRTPGTGA